MSYRALYRMVVSKKFEGPASIESWFQDHGAEETEWLQDFSARARLDASPEREDLWRLYALSRVLEVMALSFQAGNADGTDWRGPGFSVDQWCSFAERLGLTVHVPQRFSPFDCELYRPENGNEPDQPITLAKVHWPCLMLGNMLICRAGVSALGGRNVFSAQLAETSTLFWAYWRKYRPHEDLSHGWGHNSQWSTSFRRDYRVDGRLHYNVDGEHDLAARKPTGPYHGSGTDNYQLTREERVELLTHRCLIVADKERRGLWPYNDKIVLEERTGP
jgi:hypothetical protein